MPKSPRIPLKRESQHLEPLEECCFCGEPTASWTALLDRLAEDQVACCNVCAHDHAQSDVPTKKQWCEVQ